MQLRSLSSRRTLSRAGCCRSSGCMVTPSSAVVALWDTTKSHRALDREGSAAPQQQQLAHCATCVTCALWQTANNGYVRLKNHQAPPPHATPFFQAIVKTSPPMFVVDIGT